MSNKVLYLSYDGLTDPLGQSQILPYLCGLSNEYSITIISFEKNDRFLRESKLINDICDKNKIRWIPKIYHKSPPVLSTLYDIFQLRKQCYRLHSKEKFDLIHCRSYITALVGLNLKRKFKIKFLFDMRGFWADERVEGGLWNLKNPLYKIVYNFFKRKELDFLNEADHVISLTHNAKTEILTWGIKTPITLIPCCVDLDHFNPASIEQDRKRILRKELGIRDNDFVLLYLGSLGTWYMVREMLEFFTILKERQPSAKFLIVSYDKLDLASYRYHTDVIIQSAERKLIPVFISIATASISFIKPSFSKKASSATKMAEVLSMNVPIIVNSGWGDVDRIMHSENGCIIDKLNDKHYKRSVASLIKLIETRSVNNTQLLVAEQFSLPMGVKRYCDVYSKLK